MTTPPCLRPVGPDRQPVAVATTGAITVPATALTGTAFTGNVLPVAVILAAMLLAAMLLAGVIAAPAAADEAALTRPGVPPVRRRADAATFEQPPLEKTSLATPLRDPAPLGTVPRDAVPRDAVPRDATPRDVPATETTPPDAAPGRFEPAVPRESARSRSSIISAAAAPTHAEPADAAAFTALLTRLFGGRSLDAAISASLVLAVASLAPAVLLMTTCFVRMSIVLSLVRQGLGTPNLPSNQILTSLALFLSALVMWPVWTAAYRDGVEPYQQGRLELAAACERGSLPVRRWMAAQIEQAGNRDTMLFFLARHPAAPLRVATYDDVPVETLLPAFLVSELKAAFAIGFRLLLPFLVLDVIVATLVVSTGLVMLPPTLVALPLKLLVFVAADGWSLVVRALLDGMRGAV